MTGRPPRHKGLRSGPIVLAAVIAVQGLGTARADEPPPKQASKLMIGWALVIIGIPSALCTGMFLVHGSNVNASIKEGGYEDADAIKEAASSGALSNGMAISFGILSGISFGVGIPLILTDAPRSASSKPSVAILPAPGGAAVRVSF